MTFNYIRVISIKNKFSEFNKCFTHKTLITDVVKEIEKPNQDTSLYEFLYNDCVARFFMDIENSLNDGQSCNDYIVDEIIRSFCNFMLVFNIKFTKVAITKNTHSENHNGNSYHVIFDGVYVKQFSDMKFWMRAFTALYPSYSRFIDPIVYKIDRMFKLPNQYGVNKEGIHVRTNSDNIHKPYELRSIYYNQDSNGISFGFETEKPLKYFTVQVGAYDRLYRRKSDDSYFVSTGAGERVSREIDLSIYNIVREYPFDYSETMKIKTRNISQEGDQCTKEKTSTTLKPDTRFKIMKYKLKSSDEEKMKFINEVDSCDGDISKSNYLKSLTPDQIDQLADLLC